MTTKQFQADLAAAALRMSRTTPGVDLAVIRDAMIVGADLAFQFSAAAVKFEREELALKRDRENLPN